MSIELAIDSSRDIPAELHDTIQKDGSRAAGLPMNCDRALQSRNEHFYGDILMSDRDKFNALYADTIARYNATQKRKDRKLGPESSKAERQMSYYDGIMSGSRAYCKGKFEKKETAVFEEVFGIGNHEDNGITDKDFDIEKWKTLKRSGHEDEASEYALAHLNQSETVERSKRILRRAVNRIAEMNPENLVVLRADFHGDEPCGSPHVHIAFTLRATEGYKSWLTERCASVRALSEMGYDYNSEECGFEQMRDRFKDIIEEEMAADALEYGYEPIKRKAPSGEHREHLSTNLYRETKAREAELNAIQEELVDLDRQLAIQAMNNQDMNEAIDRRLVDMAEQQDKVAAEFQRREDALDAQKRAVEKRDADVSHREMKVQLQSSRVSERERSVKSRELSVTAQEDSMRISIQDMNERNEYLDSREKSLDAREEAVKTEEKRLADERRKISEVSKKLQKLVKVADSLPEDPSLVACAKQFTKKIPVFERDALGKQTKTIKKDADGNYMYRIVSCYDHHLSQTKRREQACRDLEDILQVQRDYQVPDFS